LTHFISNTSKVINGISVSWDWKNAWIWPCRF